SCNISTLNLYIDLSSSIICSSLLYCSSFFFFFNDTATTEIYTLSLHDALPILKDLDIGLLDFPCEVDGQVVLLCWKLGEKSITQDRKSTRLNSSHLVISYAVFCLKKKKKTKMYHYHI